jgi:hypothetical protein
MPRRHVVAIALLLCVPLPLLSLAATVIPLPQIVQRATATFISIAVPVVDDGPLMREKTAAVRPVEITYEPSERVRAATAVRPNRPAAQARARTARPSGSSQAAVQIDAGGGHHGASGEKSPPRETTDRPTSGEAPADDQTGPGASADPPISTTPAPAGGHGPSGGISSGGSSGEGNPGGGSGGGGSGSGGDPSGGSSGDGSGGGSPSGGDSGEVKPTDPPDHGRDDPPGGGNGKSDAPGSDPGSGPAPQPEPSPPHGGPPDKGHGKP